jgi:hypothetical protein
VNRSIWDFFGAYIACLLLALVCEWGVNRYDRQLLPGYDAPTMRDFLENVGSYLLAAQVGVLAIVSVAVAVVTLLSDRDDASSINTDIRLYYVDFVVCWPTLHLHQNQAKYQRFQQLTRPYGGLAPIVVVPGPGVMTRKLPFPRGRNFQDSRFSYWLFR